MILNRKPKYICRLFILAHLGKFSCMQKTDVKWRVRCFFQSEEKNDINSSMFKFHDHLSFLLMHETEASADKKTASDISIYSMQRNILECIFF